jgi:hypothetical protein
LSPKRDYFSKLGVLLDLQSFRQSPDPTLLRDRYLNIKKRGMPFGLGCGDDLKLSSNFIE